MCVCPGVYLERSKHNVRSGTLSLIHQNTLEDNKEMAFFPLANTLALLLFRERTVKPVRPTTRRYHSTFSRNKEKHTEQVSSCVRLFFFNVNIVDTGRNNYFDLHFVKKTVLRYVSETIMHFKILFSLD